MVDYGEVIPRRIRSGLRIMRRALEGLLLWPLLLVMLAGLLAVLVLCPRSCLRHRRRVGNILYRWGGYALQGLHSARTSWWVVFEHEGTLAAARYVLILELFGLLNLASRRKSHEPREAKKTLVVKFGHFGDTLHAVPMLRALRRAQPASEISMLVGPWCEHLACRIPYVDHVYVFTPHVHSMHRGDNARTRSLLREIHFLWSLRRQHFDLLIVTYRTGLVDLMLMESIHPVAWLGPPAAKCLFTTDSAMLGVDFEHEVYDATRLLHMLERIGITSEDDALEYWITPEEERAYRNVVLEHQLNKEPGWVVVTPGSGWSGKNWRAERFAALSDRMIEAYGVKIILCGGPAETVLGLEVQRNMCFSPVNLVGITSWGVLAALVRDARLLIGNDSGPMHLAAAFHTPTVTFWGPTSPAMWAPRGPGHMALRHVDGCPGCLYWQPFAACIRGNTCMDQITMEEAFASAHRVIRGRGAKASRADR